jgi:hypothetical protein
MGTTTKTPVHLWVVGVFSLLWNAFGGFDYTMTQTHNAAYLASYTEAQRAWFQSFPAWMVAAWAIGVWGAVAGSILLLLRSRHAVSAFALSLAGLAVSTVWQNFLAEVKASAMSRPGDLYINIAIWVAAILLLVYTWRMRANGTLR